MTNPTRILFAPGAVARVTLNRPEVRNAMDDVALRELAAAFKTLGRDKRTRVVVVSGSGKDFCAGADINWMRRAGKLPPAQGRKDARLLAEMCRAIDECPAPVIGRLHGAVYGGGLGVAACCDVVVAEENARMCFSECRLGILPAVVSCFVLPKIGAAARRYYLTAEVFGMAQAKAMGLVHEVCPEAELDAKVSGLVAHILRNGPQAVREAKALIRKLAPGLALERKVGLTIDTLVRLRSSAEGQEGLSAFLEERPASWAVPPS